jgi:hypothetical protein
LLNISAIPLQARVMSANALIHNGLIYVESLLANRVTNKTNGTPAQQNSNVS